MTDGLRLTKKAGECVIAYKNGDDYLENPGNIVIIDAQYFWNRPSSPARFHISGNYKILEYSTIRGIESLPRTPEMEKLEKIINGIIFRQPKPLCLTRYTNQCLVGYKPEEDVERNPDNVLLLVVERNQDNCNPKLHLHLWGKL